jgi:hypothetical protein
MQNRGKTQTRTFRFGVDVLKRLGRAAERAGTSENEFVAALLERRLLVDPLIPAFKGMTLDSDSMESFLVSGNLDVLEAAFSEKAQKNFPLILKLYETKEEPLDFWRFVVEILGRYCQWFYVEGSDKATHRWMVLRHSYGMKWSRCVRAYIVSSYGTTSKDKIRVEISDQLIRIDFQPS